MTLPSTPLRISLRRLGRAPLFSLVTVLTLALGIGATIAVFSVVNGVLLRPLPFPDPDGILAVWHEVERGPVDRMNHTQATYLLYREHGRSFEEVGVFTGTQANLTGGDRPERLRALVMSEGLLPVLRVEPILGRRLTPEDVAPGAAPVALLSRGAWNRVVGGDPNALGRSLRIDGVSHEVVGVLPDGIRLQAGLQGAPEIFLPLQIDRADLVHGNFNLTALARLRPGVTVEAASAEMALLTPRLTELYPGPIPARIFQELGMSPDIHPLKDDIVGDVARVLWLLLGAVGIVLLMACANVANLFLVRAEGRSREMAVRRALGAGPGRVTADFLGESFLLAGMGGALGLLLAAWGLGLLRRMGPDTLPRLDEVALDWRVFGFAVAISALTGVVLGLLPLLRNRESEAAGALKEGGRGGGGSGIRTRARNALVVSQVGLALVLLVGSGLMIRTFVALHGVEPGVHAPHEILTFQVAMPAAEVADPLEGALLWRQILDRIEGLPGVVAAGGTTGLPLAGVDDQSGTWFEDFPVEEDALPEIILTRFVTPGYSAAMGIPLIAGRDVEWRDVEQRAPLAWVSEALARRLYGGSREALGGRLRQGLGDEPWLEIAGVLADVRDGGMDEPPPAIVYRAAAGRNAEGEPTVSRNLSVAVRAQGDPLALAGPVREAVWAENRNLPVANVQTQEAIIRESMARTSFAALLLGIAAAVALILGSVGIYGVIGYLVSQRTREIGVRVAMGARTDQVRRMILVQALRLTSVGIVVGGVAALGSSRFLGTLLYGVDPFDPVTYAGVAALLAMVATLSAWIPARRAAAVEPLEALRTE